jgi:hypothetical protein
MLGCILAEIRLSWRTAAVAFVFALHPRIGWGGSDADVTKRFELIALQVRDRVVNSRIADLGGITEE